MTPSIFGTIPARLPDTPSTAPAATPPTPPPQTPAPELPTDTVTLSQSAQVSQLYQQGRSPAQIAENLGIGQSEVDSDLGLISTIATAATASASEAVTPNKS